MRTAKKGDTVRIHFSGSFDDGTQFATTKESNPVEFTIGDGTLIECFEKSVIGMAEGATKTVHLEPSEAMGEKRQDLITSVPRHLISEGNVSLKVGSKLHVKDQTGKPLKATVKHLTEDEVLIDANHPLAGEALNFDIEIIEIV
jgi:peptidylprolyl isomerase